MSLRRVPQFVKTSAWKYVRSAILFTPVSRRFLIPLEGLIASTSDLVAEAARSNKILEPVDFRSVKKSVAEARWLLPLFL